MLSVSAYYENGVFVPLEALELKERQPVIVTVLDKSNLEKARRVKVLEALSGIIPATITDEEVKECRTSK